LIQFRPIAATWEDYTGKDGQAKVVTKPGALLLQFTPLNEASGPNQKKFAWNRSLVIALSATEIGSFLSDISDSISFVRNSNAASRVSGSYSENQSSMPERTKSLQVNPVEEGYFFNMTETKMGEQQKISVMVSKAEMETLKSLTSSVLPALVGWDVLGPNTSNSNPMDMMFEETNQQSPYISDGKDFFDPQ